MSDVHKTAIELTKQELDDSGIDKETIEYVINNFWSIVKFFLSFMVYTVHGISIPGLVLFKKNKKRIFNNVQYRITDFSIFSKRKMFTTTDYALIRSASMFCSNRFCPNNNNNYGTTKKFQNIAQYAHFCELVLLPELFEEFDEYYMDKKYLKKFDKCVHFGHDFNLEGEEVWDFNYQLLLDHSLNCYDPLNKKHISLYEKDVETNFADIWNDIDL